MVESKNTILNHQQIQHKIRRIAYQIYESNVNEHEVILAGIESNGYLLAKKIKSSLDDISDIKSTLCKVIIDKRHPLSEIKTSLAVKEYSNKSIVLIDDVLNSGSTLIYGVKHFLNKVIIDKRHPLSEIKTSLAVEEYSNKSIVLIDDVLNSGSTLIYGVKHFLNVPLKQFKTVVLVNRNHKKYPVKADFKGISLSTSLHEHVEVILEGKNFEAFLK